jgi:glucose-1-phosphate cytidylyltransferase
MVFQPEIFDYLKDDTTIFEQDTFQKLVENNQLMSYVHKGFWQCMDTKHEKDILEACLEQGNAPWKVWKD